jgi:dienelactone hydrolase
MQKVSFTSQGSALSGNLFSAANAQPMAFLFIHGWTGHQNLAAAQAVADLGFTSMTYDMRGHNDSEGELADFSRADFLDDAMAAYDFLKQQVGTDSTIGVVGSSLGSYIAVLLTGQRPVKCLSLRVPATYPDKGFTDPQLPQADTPELTAWRNEPVSYDNRAFKALHDFTGKVQIIEADRDQRLPHQAAQNYVDSVVDKNNLEYVVMHDAPHQLENETLRAEYITLLTNWVNQLK